MHAWCHVKKKWRNMERKKRVSRAHGKVGREGEKKKEKEINNEREIYREARNMLKMVGGDRLATRCTRVRHPGTLSGALFHPHTDPPTLLTSSGDLSL